MDEAASTLSLAGARIVEVALPAYPPMEAAGAIIIHGEGLDLHRPSIRDHADLRGRMASRASPPGVVLTVDDQAAPGRWCRASRPRWTR